MTRLGRHWFRAAGAAALCLIWILPACNDLDRPPHTVTLADEAAYGSMVQPYVGLACGSMDCHGDAGRSLRIYAEHGLRSRGELRGQPVTDEELRDNVRAFAGVSPRLDDPAAHLALLKGLDPDAGGMAHKGDPVWRNTNAPGYQCVLAWLSNTTDTAAAQQACADAYADVELPMP